MPTCQIRSTATSESVMAITGVPSMMTRLVAYMDQRNNGILNQVMPGARMRWIVTMKFNAVRIDENPATNTPIATVVTSVCEYFVENGG